MAPAMIAVAILPMIAGPTRGMREEADRRTGPAPNPARAGRDMGGLRLLPVAGEGESRECPEDIRKGGDHPKAVANILRVMAEGVTGKQTNYRVRQDS